MKKELWIIYVNNFYIKYQEKKKNIPNIKKAVTYQIKYEVRVRWMTLTSTFGCEPGVRSACMLGSPCVLCLIISAVGAWLLSSFWHKKCTVSVLLGSMTILAQSTPLLNLNLATCTVHITRTLYISMYVYMYVCMYIYIYIQSTPVVPRTFVTRNRV